MKQLQSHIACDGARRLDVLGLISLMLLSMLVIWSCGDERTEPPTAPDPGYTRTIVLAQDAVSNGQEVTMTFTVDSELAPVTLPGVDQPARLYLTAYIRPDDDILWRESIIDDSIPAWEDPVLEYQIAIEETETDIEALTALVDSCEANPECPGDSLTELQTALADAEAVLTAWQDSLAAANADTTRLGLVRDSLAVVVDDRFRLALKFDDDPFLAYPNAIYADEDYALSGQAIYLAATGANELKGKTFSLDLAQFNAADVNNMGRPIELNWTTCFSGVDRPCLSPGSHSFTVSLTGNETYVSAVLVLVYAEEVQ
ncbi:hypothetical protein KKC97_08985 [bacterium]|nr:hypothetical protein [bacterium]MBU1637784.1 hypothetical protein [bacterium]MBU1920170.1 hypothetical protein [bacterium]